MARRGLNRRGRARPRRGGRRRSLMATAAGPWIKIFLIVALALGAVFCIYKYAVPPVLKLLNIEWPPSTPAPPTPTPLPTPSPHPLISMDVTEIQREIELDSETRFATDPMRFGDKIIYTGGSDENKGQKNHTIFIYDINTNVSEDIGLDLPLENDDYFQPQMNDGWLVYLDHKRSGGGYIRAYDREKGSSFVVKEYYVGMPTITLAGDRVCWTERTGSYMDKVFLFDLPSQENVCLYTLNRTVFGQSACHMSEDEIVWAGFDTADTSNESELATINYFKFNESSSSPGIFETKSYVHNPKTNGNVRAWIDTNGGPDAMLYISINGQTPIQIEGSKGVTGYALGSDFVAYCEDERMHAYYWGKDGFDKILSIPGENCIFSGVSDDTVFWFVTGVSQNDILKFAALNELSPQNTPIQLTPTPDMQSIQTVTPSE